MAQLFRQKCQNIIHLSLLFLRVHLNLPADMQHQQLWHWKNINKYADKATDTETQRGTDADTDTDTKVMAWGMNQSQNFAAVVCDGSCNHLAGCLLVPLFTFQLLHCLSSCHVCLFDFGIGFAFSCSCSSHASPSCQMSAFVCPLYRQHATCNSCCWRRFLPHSAANRMAF